MAVFSSVQSNGCWIPGNTYSFTYNYYMYAIVYPGYYDPDYYNHPQYYVVTRNLLLGYYDLNEEVYEDQENRILWTKSQMTDFARKSGKYVERTFYYETPMQIDVENPIQNQDSYVTINSITPDGGVWADYSDYRSTTEKTYTTYEYDVQFKDVDTGVAYIFPESYPDGTTHTTWQVWARTDDGKPDLDQTVLTLKRQIAYYAAGAAGSEESAAAAEDTISILNSCVTSTTLTGESDEHSEVDSIITSYSQDVTISLTVKADADMSQSLYLFCPTVFSGYVNGQLLDDMFGFGHGFNSN